MTEDLLLDNTLEVLDTKGYEAAYQYLLDNKHLLCETDANASLYYFLSCLAAGCQEPEVALKWLEAQTNAKPMCTWQQKQKSKLLLNFHGNGENAEIARNTWRQIETEHLQVESVQSSRVHAYERFRWHYDDDNYKEALTWLEPIQRAGYDKLFLAGFSAGCDMILRLLTLTDTSCRAVLLQSPWTPFIETHAQVIADAFKLKNIKVHIYCGALDENSLKIANNLHEILKNNGVHVALEIQPNLRHQFPEVLGEAYHSVI